MALRNRDGRWHYRFRVDGVQYAQSTGLAATKRNEIAARQQEAEHRQALIDGRSPTRRVMVREFSDAADQFLSWAKTEYREHPSSERRIRTSFTSLKEFFGQKPVSLVTAGQIEDYKSWRAREHKVRDITIRHDLHALSTFFQYAIKQGWARENRVREVSIPSDAEAVRIHVLTSSEEREYFRRASKYRDLHDAAKLISGQGLRPEEVIELKRWMSISIAGNCTSAVGKHLRRKER